jgi:hypothetical protein
MRKKKKNSHIKRRDPNDPKYIEEQKYLKRWKKGKSPPSIYEKIDNDPVYASALKSRVIDDPLVGKSIEISMGNKVRIGRPKGPR